MPPIPVLVFCLVAVVLLAPYVGCHLVTSPVPPQTDARKSGASSLAAAPQDSESSGQGGRQTLSDLDQLLK